MLQKNKLALDDIEDNINSIQSYVNATRLEFEEKFEHLRKANAEQNEILRNISDKTRKLIEKFSNVDIREKK